MNGIVLAARLAVQELLFERRIFLFSAFGLAAVLAPLLLLFALKFGVVDILLTRLLDDPRNREIRSVGSQTLDRAWLEDVAQRDDVAFFMPRTVSITMQQECAVDGIPAPPEHTCNLIPTGPGDPLIPEDVHLGEDDTAVLASQVLLDTLGLSVGDIVRVRVPRSLEGVSENGILRLRVVGAVPSERLEASALFVPLALVTAVQNYQVGIGTPAYGLEGREPVEDRQTFYGFRLYTHDLTAVAGLAEYLRANGVPVSTRAADIQGVVALNRSLSRIFLIIALLGGIGYMIALAAMLWAHVERKRRPLSVLQLLGVSRQYLVLFPIVQSAAIALMGAFVATVFALIAAFAVNIMFADGLIAGENVAILRVDHIVMAWAITLGGAVIAASIAAGQVSNIDPSEGIRDV